MPLADDPFRGLPDPWKQQFEAAFLEAKPIAEFLGLPMDRPLDWNWETMTWLIGVKKDWGMGGVEAWKRVLTDKHLMEPRNAA